MAAALTADQGGDRRPLGARRCRLNRVGDELFAGAGLAENEHVMIADDPFEAEGVQPVLAKAGGPGLTSNGANRGRPPPDGA